MSNHILGVHWQRIHPDNPRDFGHFHRMQYKSYTIFKGVWDDKEACRLLLEAAPSDAIFLLRDHAKSEEKPAVISDPAGTGTAHALDWGRKFERGEILLPASRFYCLGVNELDTNQYQRQNNVYTVNFAKTLATFGLRAGGWSFGVGHPSTRNLDPKQPPDWSWYRESAEILLKLDGIAAIHEYWMPDNYGWGNWAGRFTTHCPYDIPVVIKESWIDSGVAGKFPSRGYRDYYDLGTREKVNLALENYNYYQSRMSMDKRVHSVQMFTYDTNDDWNTFDVMPILDAIEQYPWSLARNLERDKTHIPFVPNTPPQQNTVRDTQLLGHPVGGFSQRTQRFGENPADYAQFGIPGHNGVDWAAAEGTAVLAVAAGEVQFVGFDDDYGNYIRVFHHELGFHSFYAHLATMAGVQVGSMVRKGSPMGAVGSTGNSTGSHLHLEIRLANPDGSYAEGAAGYGKGRVDPDTVYEIMARCDLE